MNIFNKNQNLSTILLILIISYGVFSPIFSTYFFMEDFYFLHLTNLNNINANGFLKIFSPEKDSIYRPISQQLLFFVLQVLLPLKPFLFALVFYFVHVLNSWLVLKLFDNLLKNKLSAFWLSLTFVCSPIFFTGLFSMVTSHFMVGLTFFLIGILVWMREKLPLHKKSMFMFILLALAVFSSEYTAVLPIIVLIVFGLSWKKIVALSPSLLLICGVVLINYFFAGENNADFNIALTAALQLMKWYLLRGFGLPEGIKNGTLVEQNIIYGLFVVLIFIVGCGIVKNWRNIAQERLGVSKYLAWVVVGCLPFLFLPNHLNPIYFSISLIGFLLIIGLLLKKTYLIAVYAIISLIISFFSVRLMMDTHWMTRRSKLVKDTIESISKERIENNFLTLTTENESDLEELKLVMYGDLGPRVMLDQDNLIVKYELERNLENY